MRRKMASAGSAPILLHWLRGRIAPVNGVLQRTVEMNHTVPLTLTPSLKRPPLLRKPEL
jgi:hypothetical protein